ncbi:MAG: cytidine deaminase [bacterium]|nr:cytidine deaminase [bacterium]
MASPNRPKFSFRNVKFEDLSTRNRNLLLEAKRALDQSYNVYSHFHVAAALGIDDSPAVGAPNVITGTNVENAAYGSAICAERSALLTAHNRGVGDRCVAIAIIARAGDQETAEVTGPCGECRQVIMEAAFRSGVKESFRVILATTSLAKIVVTTIGSLLPFAFTPADLGKVFPFYPQGIRRR